jgi:hypothetical protein
MKRKRVWLLACALVALAGRTWAQEPSSVQLVGNFRGITCMPNDPANNMEPLGDHLWRKLKFIDEPGSPDTIFFKFTRDASFAPKHWGWSGTWGTAEFSVNPPSIAFIAPDSGYYYFNFDDSDYRYWLDRPRGCIHGVVSAENEDGVPWGTSVALYDSIGDILGTFESFTDSTFHFDSLCASVYRICAHAPGYRDTTIAGVLLGEGESKEISILLARKVGVLIAEASCARVRGGVRITWSTMERGGYAAFDVYRGRGPELITMERRNRAPVSSSVTYEFFDPCEDPTMDLYYYLVELGEDNPTRYGPLFVPAGDVPAARLGQNYPNPFNPSTTIPYSVGAAGAGKAATMSFYNVAGELVDSYSLGVKHAGDYSFRWNPLLRKRSLSSGVYYCRLQIGKDTYTQKLILLR